MAIAIKSTKCLYIRKFQHFLNSITLSQTSVALIWFPILEFWDKL